MHALTELDREALRNFCTRWPIQELSLFGSALRNDFGPESDLDFLVAYTPGAKVTLLDEVEMQAELETLCGRHVDLVSRQAVEGSPNRIRRQAILERVESIYAASR
ncbi:MAG: nucleotidyltransferase domain-containing protein [Candidatus Hydrogenedentes bacterium]|nr:nucleotidyltransferase domain-containing protein [Candidatus Hydrogenedentota bacterium]